MLQEKIDQYLEILVCPICKEKLEYNEDKKSFLCNNCEVLFGIKEDIPVLLVSEAINMKIKSDE
jgi:uncharacterized protein YbaR (Trm112 family)